MDTRFSVAVHLLTLISQSPVPLSSEEMAGSVGTNASYVRKILSLLKRGGIVHGRRGVSGHVLTVEPGQLTLLEVYRAVTREERPRLLDIHRNPDDRCTVGRHIRPVLEDMFSGVETAFLHALAEMTLEDCIDGIRRAAEGPDDQNET